MLLWLGAYICNWLAGYRAIFLCLVVGFRPRFHSGHLAPSEVSCLKRRTTLRWPHWIFALIQWPPRNVVQVQASPQLLGKRNACALHFRELKKNSHRSRQCTSAVCWKCGINVMQKSSKLELFYQIVKIHEFLKYARRSRVSKALPLDDLSGAVSA